MLTQARVRELFAYNSETGRLTWITKPSNNVQDGGRAGGSNKSNGYRRVAVNGVNYQEHRVIWLFVHGYMPPNQIDHINTIRDDNRIGNLKLATSYENNRNRKTHFAGALVGAHHVYPNKKNPWRACLWAAGCLFHIGYFPTELEAHDAWLLNAREWGVA